MTRKLLSLLAIAAMLTLGACGSDNDEPTPTIVEVTIDNPIVTSAAMYNESGVINPGGTATLSLNYTAGRLNVHLKNISTAVGLPMNIDLTNMATVLTSDRKGTFSGNGIKISDVYTANNVRGSFDLDKNILIIALDLVYETGSTHVNIHTSQLLSALPTGDDYESTTERYYNLNMDQGKANLEIYNIQFVAQMPKQKRLRIPLEGATITVSTTGYIIEGTGIVPYFTSGTTEVPMAERQVDNLKAVYDLTTRTFTIEFDCFGLHFTDSGNIYP